VTGVTCTINNNDVAPTLKLVKTVTNNNGGSAIPNDWELYADGILRPFHNPGGSGTPQTVWANIGYTLSETGPDHYTASPWSCTGTGSHLVGKVLTLDEGAEVTCTINNDDIQPKLTVFKHVDNGGFGGKSADDFTLMVGSSPPGCTPTSCAGGQEFEGSEAGKVVFLNAGTYEVNENDDDAYVKIYSGDCDSSGFITLSIGDVKTCTITNIKKGTVIVEKYSYAGTGTFWFRLKDGTDATEKAVVTEGFPAHGDATFNNVIPTGILDYGEYTLTEIEAPAGWTLMFASCDDGTNGELVPGQGVKDIVVGVGDTVICKIYNIHKSIVTSSSLCTFDYNSQVPGDQFRLLFTQDPTAPSYYKLTASNPGQFFYNMFVVDPGTGKIKVDIYLPFPFVTQGATPIHAYSSATVTTYDGQTCIVPGEEVFNSKQRVNITDYKPMTFGSTTKVTVEFDYSGFVYLNIHLDYGLKNSTGWIKMPSTSKYGGDDAYNMKGPYAGLRVRNFDDKNYTFSYFLYGDSGDAQNVSNENRFKKNPGVAGRVNYPNDFGGAPGVTVELYRVDSPGLKTFVMRNVTDDDGVFMIPYKHTGKAATFQVMVKDYLGVEHWSAAFTLKSNMFWWIVDPLIIPMPPTP